MTTVFLAIIGTLLLVILFFYFTNKIINGELKEAKAKNDKYKEVVNNLSTENSKLQEASEIVNKNRKETNEKIDELHTGDTLLNAISGLSKHRDSNS